MTAEITEIVHVDKSRAVKDPEYARSFSKTPSFCVYDERFIRDVIGSAPKIQLIEERREKGEQFAHEAGVYIRATNSVYFTSNFQTCDPIDLYAINCDTHKIEKLDYPEVVQANGACNYPGKTASVHASARYRGDVGSQPDRILYCSQGDHSMPSGLVLVDPVTKESEIMINNFHGREFSSVNDVVIHHDTGDIWFTDPTYGHEQGFRPDPLLPAHVYRFRPSTNECSVLADGFDMCNGLCFSPDYSLLYVTDTGAVKARSHSGDGHKFKFNYRNAGTIYVYDVVDKGTRIANRRTFAFCDLGVPDGIKCDENGYVYAGCGDGVHVWDPNGVLVGKIIVGCTTANFCFVKGGIWMFSEKDLYFCKIRAKGALVKIECE
ncbi:uncharacterized protein GIQ15_06769 [Arthroderma uncinatum]|uniref:uncharacterized protein n=1 Tax=Arthroderma uncinatum TaxID=74035 RepID=UPI00144A7B8A|nr:uncharacterized protein GIQ15_06769 [Arthroderma uncinatum]KAF3479793.1 hypothetical protein GIQ15_06769 [Arthroderma uncinatum]